ncbi:hypothetical protein HYH03_000043 [Edaphochlamys debaryana]|uniref:Guanylate cyclase domain-containing protein n=1 Tax=Edaphochlamys debaryana TaxID=47281 RepID=A0A836C5S9_9CHLO|nr:hypothetical protein HYH03_000043 [Edaphochlamys debaryana]|eukprot:KAG2501536.1 hypothetical protein HYH03_000043 [Edaphochlamys debaryana]
MPPLDILQGTHAADLASAATAVAGPASSAAPSCAATSLPSLTFGGPSPSSLAAAAAAAISLTQPQQLTALTSPPAQAEEGVPAVSASGSMLTPLGPVGPVLQPPRSRAGLPGGASGAAVRGRGVEAEAGPPPNLAHIFLLGGSVAAASGSQTSLGPPSLGVGPTQSDGLLVGGHTTEGTTDSASAGAVTGAGADAAAAAGGSRLGEERRVRCSTPDRPSNDGRSPNGLADWLDRHQAPLLSGASNDTSAALAVLRPGAALVQRSPADVQVRSFTMRQRSSQSLIPSDSIPARTTALSFTGAARPTSPAADPALEEATAEAPRRRGLPRRCASVACAGPEGAQAFSRAAILEPLPKSTELVVLSALGSAKTTANGAQPPSLQSTHEELMAQGLSMSAWGTLMKESAGRRPLRRQASGLLFAQKSLGFAAAAATDSLGKAPSMGGSSSVQIGAQDGAGGKAASGSIQLLSGELPAASSSSLCQQRLGSQGQTNSNCQTPLPRTVSPLSAPPINLPIKVTEGVCDRDARLSMDSNHALGGPSFLGASSPDASGPQSSAAAAVGTPRPPSAMHRLLNIALLATGGGGGDTSSGRLSNRSLPDMEGQLPSARTLSKTARRRASSIITGGADTAQLSGLGSEARAGSFSIPHMPCPKLMRALPPPPQPSGRAPELAPLPEPEPEPPAQPPTPTSLSGEVSAGNNCDALSLLPVPMAVGQPEATAVLCGSNEGGAVRATAPLGPRPPRIGAPSVASGEGLPSSGRSTLSAALRGALSPPAADGGCVLGAAMEAARGSSAATATANSVTIAAAVIGPRLSMSAMSNHIHTLDDVVLDLAPHAQRAAVSKKGQQPSSSLSIASDLSAAQQSSPATKAVMPRMAWHEVTLSAFAHPSLRRPAVLLVQTDVTARIYAERQLARVMEAEHELLENIFPAHVIEHMAVAAARAAEKAVEAEAGASTLAACLPHAKITAGQLPDLAALPAPHLPVGLQIRGDTFLHLATSHSAITIMFCDIQGFTAMCGVVKPVTVMAFLNDLYTRLDAQLDAFGVYKVETIGDCYMVAGGLMRVDEETGAKTVRSDDVDPDHASRTVQFAKALLKTAAEVRLPTTGEPVRLRVGIHSGPAMSGVVGTRMPRFCLFGDTINTASRMESTGAAGAIHVSQATRDLVPSEAWEPTGGVEAKGKGVLETYLLRLSA